jgi:hypothetical protein
MNGCYLMAIAAALMAAPAALAHDPPGTLKNYCEDPAEWNTHDYGPPATGIFIALGQDGNIAGDCNEDGVPADYDLHIEWAIGGAWLTVGTVPDCNSETGHHPRFGPIRVDDAVNGNTQAFTVASDFINRAPVPDQPDCGDFESDESTDCVGSCSVTFPEGLDGTYQVYVGAFTFPLGDELRLLLGDLGAGEECCSATCLLSSCSCCGTVQSCSCSLLGEAECVCSSPPPEEGSIAPGTVGHITAP